MPHSVSLERPNLSRVHTGLRHHVSLTHETHTRIHTHRHTAPSSHTSSARVQPCQISTHPRSVTGTPTQASARRFPGEGGAQAKPWHTLALASSREDSCVVAMSRSRLLCDHSNRIILATTRITKGGRRYKRPRFSPLSKAPDDGQSGYKQHTIQIAAGLCSRIDDELYRY